jgi:ATP-dependent RNA helicase RhlE
MRYQSYRPGGFRGQRPIKSFNPYHLVVNQHVAPSVQPEAISHSFSDFSIYPELLKNIISKGYPEPTPIQDKAIQPILDGQDVIGIANTGTGKTAAFLIPIINKILNNRREKVLILTPTRELAAQIQAEFYAFSAGLKILSVLCIGGVSIAPQKFNLRRDFNVVIGTPGRLKDLVEENYLHLGDFHTVILDEADHMVDVGFLPDIKFLVSRVPANRQSLFFSATIDGKVKEILAAFVKNPVTISVRTRDTVENIHQTMIKVVNMAKKVDQLHELLIQAEFEKVLIFGRTKWGVQKLSDELVKRGFRADVIHGNKSQSQRQRTLDRFKRSEIKILLATDVASRGLDIPNVSHVINYDLPDTSDAYIHRIGRTGRADKKGIALTFVD